MKFIDIVAVRFCVNNDPKDLLTELHLFEAPAWSALKEGSEVMVNDFYLGERMAKVVKCYTINPSSEEFEFILAITNSGKKLGRVLGKIDYTEFKYEEEKNGTDNG